MGRACEVTNIEPRLDLDAGSVINCIHQLDHNKSFRVPPGSLGIGFVDEVTCGDLHNRFFRDPEITDVMTFPGDADDDHAGEIAVCPAVAAACCSTEKTVFEEELTLYLVHAWLHLAGLDDKDARSKRQIRLAEKTLMDYLKCSGSLLKAGWAGFE